MDGSRVAASVTLQDNMRGSSARGNVLCKCIDGGEVEYCCSSELDTEQVCDGVSKLHSTYSDQVGD